jgi:hypothetical protein
LCCAEAIKGAPSEVGYQQCAGLPGMNVPHLWISD